MDEPARLPGRGPSPRPVPTAADYRRQMQTTQRWHTVGAWLAVAALALLVFWWLPLPSAEVSRGAGRHGAVADTSVVVGTTPPQARQSPGRQLR